jgi:hypothetical protein
MCVKYIYKKIIVVLGLNTYSNMYFHFIAVYIELGYFKFKYIQTIGIITGSMKTSTYVIVNLNPFNTK